MTTAQRAVRARLGTDLRPFLRNWPQQDGGRNDSDTRWLQSRNLGARRCLLSAGGTLLSCKHRSVLSSPVAASQIAVLHRKGAAGEPHPKDRNEENDLKRELRAAGRRGEARRCAATCWERRKRQEQRSDDARQEAKRNGRDTLPAPARAVMGVVVDHYVRRLDRISQGSASRAAVTSRNSIISRRRSPPSYLATKDCGLPSFSATFACVSPLTLRSEINWARNRWWRGDRRDLGM